MSASKSVLKNLVLFTALVAVVIFFGCGAGVEKEKMMAFMQNYQGSLDAYADAITKGDSAKKAELEAKLDAFKGQWSLLRMEIGSKITPQTSEKFEKEFEKLAKRYTELSGKS